MEFRLAAYLSVLTSLFLPIYAVENGGVVNIDLSSLNATNNVVKVREILHGSTRIRLENVFDVGYFIIQVHSFATPVYLSRANSTDADEVGVNGTNVGLVQMVNFEPTTDFDFNVDAVDHTHVLIVVVGYNIKDPIPGACNLTFETEDAPYQKISYSEALIRVDAQPPKLDSNPCGLAISVDTYHMFLEEQDFSAESYFKAIEKMLTPKDIIANGRKVEKPYGLPDMRRYYVAYQGVGTVYGIVANFRGFMSAYVPAVSYGCDVKNNIGCTGPLTTSWKVICAFMVFYGLFLAYSGHRYFEFHLFCIGFIVAAVLTYMLVSYTNLSDWETYVTLAVIGVIYGGLWLVIWWKFKRPILSVTLTYFVAGVIVSGIFFFSGPADTNLFRNNINFWSLLVGISLLITILLLVISHWPSNIIATSFIGIYIFIIPCDVYYGGTLRYIVLNLIHRATIPNFHLAIVDAPYQASDISLSICWAFMAILDSYAQWRYVRRRAPFPSVNTFNRSSHVQTLFFRVSAPRQNSENTPLLSQANHNPN